MLWLYTPSYETLHTLASIVSGLEHDANNQDDLENKPYCFSSLRKVEHGLELLNNIASKPYGVASPFLFPEVALYASMKRSSSGCIIMPPG